MAETPPLQAAPQATTPAPAPFELNPAAWMERWGLNRLFVGLVLVVLGTVVMLEPQLLRWVVGLGAIVAGAMLVAQELARDRPAS